MTTHHLSPHDRYMRAVLSKPLVAQDFFEKSLPTEIVQNIDFSTLKLQKDSFINDKLRVKIADLLYSVNLNGTPGYLYLLTEHASTPDRLLPYRMMQYVMSIMDHHKQKHPQEKKLPLVVPLILYAGLHPYNYSTDLFDLFEQKELAKSVFLNPYQLIDLHKISDKKLRETYILFGVAAFVAKHIRKADSVLLLKNVIPSLQWLRNNGHEGYVHLTLTYISKAGEVKNEDAFREVIKSGLSAEDEENVMTLTEKYRQKGLAEGMTLAEKHRQEGELKGRLEGKLKALQETALNLFKLGMGIEQVAQATTLPVQQVQDLWKKSSTSH